MNDNRTPAMMSNRGWNNPPRSSQPATPQQNRNQQNRRVEDEEIWEQRRRQQSEEVAIAVERAKLRKEEEEKRYLETKQAAAKKLQELEDKIKEKKGAEIRENDESQGTINPSTVPPQPITPAPIPVPDWERDRETRERSRTPNETTDNKHPQREADFRQLTQIEGRNFVTKPSRSTEREISRDRDVRERDREIRERDRDVRERERDVRERDAPNFSRHFQSNLPPRFQKQQAERQNTTGNYHRSGQSGSPQPQSTSNPPNVPFAQQYDPRWVQSNTNFPVKSVSAPRSNRKDDSYDKNHDENHSNRDVRRDRHTPDTERNYDSNRRISGDNRYYDDYRNYRREGSQEYDYKHDRESEKWEKEHRHYDERKEDKKDFDHDIHRQDSGEWRREKYMSHKESSEERCSDRQPDNSQRPDSRDSRISKDSLRDVNDYACWADSPFEPQYEDKKKDSYREERRQVPGPITKDRIEADDMKSEKRNLIQLKRSDKVIEKKIDDKDKKNEDIPKKKDEESKSWADQTSPTSAGPDKLMEALEKGKKSTSGDSLHKIDGKSEFKKTESIIEKDKDDKHQMSRTRMDSRGSSHKGNWGSSGMGTVYNSSWPKRGDSRSSRGSQRSSGRRHKDMHSDSEFSGDEFSVSTESGKEDRINKHGSQNKPNQSPKPLKKSDKDDKNKDKQEKSSDLRKSDKRYDQNSRDRNREPYVPRGEPTRHGRGGFRGSRSVAPSKRIDGYGIPPSKSPFGNHDERDKKHSGDEIGGEAVSSDEKTKQNQQALAAGIIGSSRNPKSEVPPRIQRKNESDRRDRSKGRAHSGSRKQKPRSKHSDENWETSDYSDTDDRKDRGKRKPTRSNSSYSQNINRQSSAPLSARNSSNPTSRNNDIKKSSFGSKPEGNIRQNSNSNLRTSQAEKTSKNNKDDVKETNTFAAAIENVKSQKEKIERSDSGENAVSEEANSDEKSFDTDGFQEVKSKKNVKDRKDEKVPPRSIKPEKEGPRNPKSKSNTTQLTPQQIANIPPLLGTPVNPPSNIHTSINTQSNKISFDRGRIQNKLAPRFVKQRENRMAKQQLQNICDVSEMNKINQNVTMYNMKDGTALPQTQITNAWDKPITTQLRNSVDAESLLNMGVENCNELEQTQQSQTSSQRSSPNTEKLIPKPSQVQDKAILDGTTPPVNTIIFENTNYKSTPVNPPADLALKAKFNSQIKTQQRPADKNNRKLEEAEIENQVMTGFNKPITDMLNKGETKPEPIQMPLSFTKAEDNADMKLDFTFDSDLTQLTDDKSSKSLGLPRSMHTMTSAQSTISPSTADLNFKIASVKKVST